MITSMGILLSYSHVPGTEPHTSHHDLLNALSNPTWEILVLPHFADGESKKRNGNIQNVPPPQPKPLSSWWLSLLLLQLHYALFSTQPSEGSYSNLNQSLSLLCSKPFYGSRLIQSKSQTLCQGLQCLRDPASWLSCHCPRAHSAAGP